MLHSAFSAYWVKLEDFWGCCLEPLFSLFVRWLTSLSNWHAPNWRSKMHRGWKYRAIWLSSRLDKSHFVIYQDCFCLNFHGMKHSLVVFFSAHSRRDQMIFVLFFQGMTTKRHCEVSCYLAIFVPFCWRKCNNERNQLANKSASSA